MTVEQSASGGRLIPAERWNEFHPWPPTGGLRHLILNAKTNGFDQVIRRIGRRILVDEQAFLDWARSKREQPAMRSRPISSKTTTTED